MKPFYWILVTGCIATSPFILAQGNDENVISLADIVEAHDEPVRVENTMVEMEIDQCLLTVIARPMNTCNNPHLSPSVGNRKITVTSDIREVRKIHAFNLDMRGFDNLNNNQNMITVYSIDPDNSVTFSRTFEKCDGTVSRSENLTSVDFGITAIAPGFFRRLPIEFDIAGCLGEGS
ncbi:hypothetical protein BC777_1346 [Yoonia maricola]|uniref:Uncharacterized protein n=1 Tax=Yoonia maricola TaxID=420999 RepID=A0A2M8WNJ3_9RHOB|nr:hypothetical protein [Yoonia maricola]PJI92494.1 hypothetical protein BC777_1346 [Yoonia maricola]